MKFDAYLKKPKNQIKDICPKCNITMHKIKRSKDSHIKTIVHICNNCGNIKEY